MKNRQIRVYSCKYYENYCSIRGIQLKKSIIVVAPKKYIDLKKIMFRNNEQFPQISDFFFIMFIRNTFCHYNIYLTIVVLIFLV